MSLTLSDTWFLNHFYKKAPCNIMIFLLLLCKSSAQKNKINSKESIDLNCKIFSFIESIWQLCSYLAMYCRHIVKVIISITVPASLLFVWVFVIKLLELKFTNFHTSTSRWRVWNPSGSQSTLNSKSSFKPSLPAVVHYSSESWTIDHFPVELYHFVALRRI